MLVAFMVVLGKLGSILRVPSIIRLLKVKEATFRSILYSQGIFTSSPSYGTLNYHSSVPGACHCLCSFIFIYVLFVAGCGVCEKEIPYFGLFFAVKSFCWAGVSAVYTVYVYLLMCYIVSSFSVYTEIELVVFSVLVPVSVDTTSI